MTRTPLFSFDWNGHAISVDWFLERLAVNMDGCAEAYLDVEHHRFFKENPGLREQIVDRVHAYTLVR
jgi:hypothetical protein